MYGYFKGLYQFETESSNESKNWAVDLPLSYADSVVEQWYSKEMEPMVRELQTFIDTDRPRWRRNLKSALFSKT